MANDETTISLFGVNATPLYRMTVENDETVIKTYDTNTPMWKINGDIAGGAKAMTTAQRTATTPKAGELIFDTDLGVLFVGDGITAGGTAVGGGGGGVIPGYRLTDDGTSLNFNPVTPIVDATGSNTVTLAPDHAYKVVATGGAVTLNANAPASGYWGLEGHIEIFVAGTGYVVTGTNVVLAQPLEPDSVNNCTVRFHDGIAIISVEDHVAGYIVVNGATSGDGSLYYGISTSTNDYVAFDASLNGTTIPLAGAVAEGEKHLVGNGYSETILTGNIDCGTSNCTVANLALSDVCITGGVLTLGDAYIPSGSTVAVSGGGLAIEKVAGNGGVIDCKLIANAGIAQSAIVSGVTITGSTATSGTNGRGGVTGNWNRKATFSDCIITGNSATFGGAFFTQGGSAVINLYNTVVSGNIAAVGKDIYNTDTVNIYGGCKIGELMLNTGATATCYGSNTFDSVVSRGDVGGRFVLTSGAILNLTGNTNSTPVAPGGGVVIGSDVQIYPSAGSVSAVEISGGTFGGITNGGVLVSPVNVRKWETVSGNATVNLNGKAINSGSIVAYDNYTLKGLTFSGGSAAYGGVLGKNDLIYYINASGCTFENNSCTSRGGAFALYAGTSGSFTSCAFNGNSAGVHGGAIHLQNGGSAMISGCTFSGNVADGSQYAIQLQGDNTLRIKGGNVFSAGQKIVGNGGSFIIEGTENSIDGLIKYPGGSNATVTISSGATINLTSSIAPGGGITVLEGGCTVNGNAIPAGTYTSIDSNGQPT